MKKLLPLLCAVAIAGGFGVASSGSAHALPTKEIDCGSYSDVWVNGSGFSKCYTDAGELMVNVDGANDISAGKWRVVATLTKAGEEKNRITIEPNQHGTVPSGWRVAKLRLFEVVTARHALPIEESDCAFGDAGYKTPNGYTCYTGEGTVTPDAVDVEEIKAGDWSVTATMTCRGEKKRVSLDKGTRNAVEKCTLNKLTLRKP